MIYPYRYVILIAVWDMSSFNRLSSETRTGTCCFVSNSKRNDCGLSIFVFLVHFFITPNPKIIVNFIKCRCYDVSPVRRWAVNKG